LTAKNRIRIPLVTLLAIGAFFLPIRFDTDALFYIHLMDAAHLPAFFLLTLFTHASWPQTTSPCRRRIFACTLTAAASIAIEIIQPLTGRSESLTDLLNGLAGIALAAIYLAIRHTPRKLLSAALFTLLATTAIATVLLPAWEESAGMRWRSHNFPLLADFETDDELKLWIGSGLGNHHPEGSGLQRVKQHATHGEYALQVATEKSAKWPGVRLLNAKQDWSQKTTLAFDIWNDGPPFTLAIRIDDDFPHRTFEDRYNTTRTIQPGANHITIPTSEIQNTPKNRRLNLHAIQRTIFFTDDPTADHTFYLDHIRLE
jgi:hypothetical protein